MSNRLCGMWNGLHGGSGKGLARPATSVGAAAVWRTAICTHDEQRHMHYEAQALVLMQPISQGHLDEGDRTEKQIKLQHALCALSSHCSETYAKRKAQYQNKCVVLKEVSPFVQRANI